MILVFLSDIFHQIEKPESLKRVDIEQNRENDDLVDTDIELEKNTTKKNELSTSESVAIKITETPDENVYTEEEMSFDDTTITGDYSDYDILEEEKENISKNDEVWVKTKKEIWRGRVLLITYSTKKRGQQKFENKTVRFTEIR